MFRQLLNIALSAAIPAGVAILMKVYPSQVVGYEDGHLLMANGERIVYDDGREKDFITMDKNVYSVYDQFFSLWLAFKGMI